MLFANVMNMPLKFWNKNQIPIQGDSNLTLREQLYIDCYDALKEYVCQPVSGASPVIFDQKPEKK